MELLEWKVEIAKAKIDHLKKLYEARLAMIKQPVRDRQQDERGKPDGRRQQYVRGEPVLSR